MEKIHQRGCLQQLTRSCCWTKFFRTKRRFKNKFVISNSSTSQKIIKKKGEINSNALTRKSDSLRAISLTISTHQPSIICNMSPICFQWNHSKFQILPNFSVFEREFFFPLHPKLLPNLINIIILNQQISPLYTLLVNNVAKPDS